MDQSAIKTLMDPLDSRIIMEMLIEQGRKLRDIVRIASVTVKGSDTQNGPATWKQQTIR